LTTASFTASITASLTGVNGGFDGGFDSGFNGAVTGRFNGGVTAALTDTVTHAGRASVARQSAPPAATRPRRSARGAGPATISSTVMQPLTHHQIIGLVEPFTRRGRHVDLGASNRLERWLVFKPATATLEVPGLAELRETLKLENPHDGWFRLTRSFLLANGLQASLSAEGADAGDLLQRVEAVAPQRVFSAGAGFVIALSFRLDAAGAAASTAAATEVKMVLTDAQAQVAGFKLVFRVPRTRGIPADVEISPAPGSTAVLPEDLLAVIGWDWAPLQAKKAAWHSKIRLRGGEPRRSRSAEAKLERTVRHLAAVLSQAPAAFHPQHAQARWGAALRRGIPSLTVIGMFIGFASLMLLPRNDLDEMTGLRILMFHVPTLLLAVAFSLQELPRFEIPPLPRPLKLPAWLSPLPPAPAPAPSPAPAHAPPAESVPEPGL